MRSPAQSCGSKYGSAKDLGRASAGHAGIESTFSQLGGAFVSVAFVGSVLAMVSTAIYRFARHREPYLQ